MRIECPNCKATGNVNDHDIPEEGMNLACPRCKHNFRITKPRKKMTSVYATNTCPSCGYSTFCEEVFDECPHCGIVVKTIIESKQQLAARKREQEHLNRNHVAEIPIPLPLPPIGIKYTNNTEPAKETRKINLAIFTDQFDPVAAISWSAIIGAVVILIIGGKGLLYYLNTDIQTKLSENSVEPVTAWQVFWGYGFAPWIQVIIGGIILAAAIGFLLKESWGLQTMQRVVSALLLLVPIYELTLYALWIIKSIDPPWWAYLVEFTSTLLFSVLWMAPLFFLQRYISGNDFKRLYQKD